MKSKHYTILLVPERTSHKVRQIKIPKLLVKAGLLSLVVIIAFSVVMTKGYFSVKSRFATELTDLNDVKKENLVKSEQIKILSDRIGKISVQVEGITKLNSQIRMMANLELPESSNKALGIGGPSTEEIGSLSALTEMEERSVKQMHSSIDKISSNIISEEESLLDLVNFLDNQKSFLASTPSVWPTRGRKTSKFGYRISPFTGKKGFHNGVDVSAREGTPIIAPADGVVVKAQNEYTYGNLVVLDHGYGIQTRYGHMLTFLVEPGQKVRRGDKIGYVGNTGRSTGSHLHYEVRASKVPVDPLKYILN
ncbi:M23 family metallopeptidase [Thermodesulfobacteriota bacterium]